MRLGNSSPLSLGSRDSSSRQPYRNVIVPPLSRGLSSTWYWQRQFSSAHAFNLEYAHRKTLRLSRAADVQTLVRSSLALLNDILNSLYSPSYRIRSVQANAYYKVCAISQFDPQIVAVAACHILHPPTSELRCTGRIGFVPKIFW